MATTPRPLTEDEAVMADTVVWVGSLACGCRPFAVTEIRGRPTAETDEAFGNLLAQATVIEVYSVEDADQIVKPCPHNLADSEVAS